MLPSELHPHPTPQFCSQLYILSYAKQEATSRLLTRKLCYCGSKKTSEDFHTVTELSDLVVGIAAVADVQEWGVDSVPSTAGLHEAPEFFLEDIYSTDPETSLSSR